MTTTTTAEKAEADDVMAADDGIGSSDDETIGSSSASTGSAAENPTEEVRDPDDGGHANDGDDEGDDADSTASPFESDASPNMSGAAGGRKVIRPDKSALDQLLAFDESEEDEEEEEEEDDDDQVRKDRAIKQLSPRVRRISPPPSSQPAAAIPDCQAAILLSSMHSLALPAYLSAFSALQFRDSGLLLSPLRKVAGTQLGISDINTVISQKAGTYIAKCEAKRGTIVLYRIRRLLVPVFFLLPTHQTVRQLRIHSRHWRWEPRNERTPVMKPIYFFF